MLPITDEYGGQIVAFAGRISEVALTSISTQTGEAASN